MLVYITNTKEVKELGRGINGLSDILGMFDVPAAGEDGLNLGATFEMNNEDFAAWKDIVNNANDIEDVYNNAIDAGWSC